MIEDEEFSFTGLGYHDKNWGYRPLAEDTQSWYWGHGRLGPYSLVWYDAIDPDGTEHISAYAAKDNTIITTSCVAGAVSVCPIGSDYPPTETSNYPEGFHISMDLGEEGQLEVDVINTLITYSSPTYYRWIGSMSGGIIGQQNYNGSALYEEINMVVAERF